MFRQLVLAVLLSTALCAQSSSSADSHRAGQNASSNPAQAQPAAADNGDDLARMRIDLDQMESMLNNMNSEITFLRDQNLQILLNTNSRMWTMLIRDLRLQINREQQRRAHEPETAAPRHAESERPSKTAPK